MDSKKNSEKSFSPAKAWEAFEKINKPREEMKKKTKYDNLLDFIETGLTNKGRVIIYRRKALAKILTVSEMTLRNYFTRMKNDGYEIVDVVENGKNAEEIVKGCSHPLDETKDKNCENPLDNTECSNEQNHEWQQNHQEHQHQEHHSE